MQVLQKEKPKDPADRSGISGLTQFDGEDICISFNHNQRC